MQGGGPHRRSFLASGVAGALAAGLARPSLALPTSGIDPASTIGKALIFKKLAYATDDRVGFWWLRGTRFALIDTKLIPLWEMHVGSAFQVRDLSPTAYEVVFLQASFYTDLTTGVFLRRFDNPLTGKTIDLGYRPPARGVVTFDAAGRTDKPGGVLANLTQRGETGPAWIEGDQVWVRGDILLDGDPATTGARPIRVNDLTTYFGSLKEVADPAVHMPLAGQIFSDINVWPPWLGLGDRPGDYYSRAFGHKVASFEAMPEIWRRLMIENYPAVARDIPATLRG